MPCTEGFRSTAPEIPFNPVEPAFPFLSCPHIVIEELRVMVTRRLSPCLITLISSLGLLVPGAGLMPSKSVPLSCLERP